MSFCKKKMQKYKFFQGQQLESIFPSFWGIYGMDFKVTLRNLENGISRAYFWATALLEKMGLLNLHLHRSGLVK